MKVYKVYTKIVWKNKITIVSFILLFIGLSYLFSFQYEGREGNLAQRVRISVQNQDADSPFSDGLKYYLDENAQLVRLVEKRDHFSDALFLRKTDYIVTIPSGFYQSLLNEEKAVLQKSSMEDSYGSIYGDMLIGRYLTAWQSCKNHNPQKQGEDIRTAVAEHLSRKTEEMEKDGAAFGNRLKQVTGYFNGISYAVIGAVISVIVIVTEAFFNQEVGKRNLISPIPVMELTKKISLGNFIMGLIVWAIGIIAAFFCLGNAFFQISVCLMACNLLIFVISMIGLGSFIAKISISRSFIYGIANGIALFMCLVSGAFPGQTGLSEEMRSLAAFFPVYWYVKANETIKGLFVLSPSMLFPVLSCFGIELGFAVAFFCLGLLFEKEKTEIETEKGTSQKFP